MKIFKRKGVMLLLAVLLITAGRLSSVFGDGVSLTIPPQGSGELTMLALAVDTDLHSLFLGFFDSTGQQVEGSITLAPPDYRSIDVGGQ